MWAEFKEKTYETYFLAELARRTTVLYSPDQNDESLLGFDGAFWLPWDELPTMLPYRRFRRWRRLIGISASEIDTFGRELNNRLPPFRFNLFVQYKRPQYLFRSNAVEWTSWDGPYFRYGIVARQQELLRRVQSKAADRAAIVYAAPAFFRVHDLFSFASSGAIAANSNIASVGLVGAHGRFTFESAGNYGVGHSQPEPIKSPRFEEMVESGLGAEALPFTRHIKTIAGQIEAALSENDDDRSLWELARQTILGGSFEDTYPRAKDTFLEAILSIIAFSEAFDTRVTAVG